MGGGPSQEQKDAAAANKVIATTTAEIGKKKDAREEAQYQEIKPFAFDRLHNGLPFFSYLMDNIGGPIARSFAPAYASLNRRFADQPDAPSGSKEAAIGRLDVEKARAFDDSIVNNLMANENAKGEAARLITGQQQIANPAPFFQIASGANNSIMQAPLQTPGYGGMIGGVGAKLLERIPF